MTGLREILIELKKEGVDLGELPSLESVASAILERRVKDFYCSIGVELTASLPTERQRLERIEAAMFQFTGSSESMDEQRSYWEKRHETVSADLNLYENYVTNYFNRAVRSLVDGRQAKEPGFGIVIEGNAPPGEEARLSTERDYNRAFLSDVKNAIRLANLAHSNNIQLDDVAFLGNSTPREYPYMRGEEEKRGVVFARLKHLYQIVWSAIERSYGHTSHSILEGLTLEKNADTRNLFGDAH